MNIIQVEKEPNKKQTAENGKFPTHERSLEYVDKMYINRDNQLTEKIGIASLNKYRWWKNFLDRALALFLIIILSPLMALVSLIIRLDSKGNVIFRREQVGENGKRFTLYKFRTMQKNNNDYKYKSYLIRYILEDAPYTTTKSGQGVYKVVDDPRVTRFGSVLRRSNIDELPQLFNILKGEMSFIGPRPDIPFAVNMYHDWHLQRLKIKPGISGLWQVSQRKECSFREMVNLDIEYINSQSLSLDTKIFLKTILLILKMDGS